METIFGGRREEGGGVRTREKLTDRGPSVGAAWGAGEEGAWGQTAVDRDLTGGGEHTAQHVHTCCVVQLCP